MTFALPTIHTWYDLLASTIAPEALIAAAERLHLAAIGIVDQATTLAHVPLAQAARASSIHVVFGATLLMEDGLPLRILARNTQGYRSLCHLVSAAQRAPVSWELLRDHRHGLYLLCGGRRSRVWQALMIGRSDALTLLGRLQALGERDDRVLIECQQYDDDSPQDGERLRQLLALAERAGARVIATQDVRVLRADEARTHRLLQAVAHQSSFFADDDRLPPWQPGVPSRYALPSPPVWYQRWDGLDHLVAGSAAVLKDCQVEILGPRRFPGASLPADHVYDQLWNRAFAGLRERYGQITPSLMQRLTHEIGEVTAQGVAPFLLHAAELVARAAARGIPMILQGSGTGSLLCYVLGISPVDPARAEGLVFERFAGAHRGPGDLPDLDFGIPAGREAEVHAILIELFGAERVASLAAVVTLQERGAVRAAAEAFGWDRTQIRGLRQKLHDGGDLDREEAMVLRAAEAIQDQPHHLMRHASGVVIADEPIADLYGVGSCADGPLVQANRVDVEALQFLKYDLLAWYGLAIYQQAEAAIRAAVYPPPELWHIPGDDALTGDLLEQTETRAIPYLQSPAMLNLMRVLKVRTEADLALCLGALRPGASTTRPRLLAAIHGGTAALDGWDQLTPDHQRQITDVLLSSRGALIFDEDLLRLAHLLGLSFADAERLRKAIKKSEERAAPHLNKLRAAALERGWSDREIDVVISWLCYIHRYTFTRGHALALACASWRVAYVAAHYPAHFFAAALDHLGDEGGGMYPPLVYRVEANRVGIQLVGPTINSPWQSAARERTIHCGLAVLRRVIALDVLKRIAAEASLRPFRSVADLRARVELTDHQLDRLICAGTLDGLVASRRQARWEAQLTADVGPQTALIEVPIVLPPVEPESVRERAQEEYATLGWTLSVAHPLDLHADALPPARAPAGGLVRWAGQRVTVAGIVVASRRIRTRTGERMGFVSLCDESGVAELLLFPRVLARAGQVLEHGAILVATGVVTDDDEHGLGLTVERARMIAADGPAYAY